MRMGSVLVLASAALLLGSRSGEAGPILVIVNEADGTASYIQGVFRTKLTPVAGTTDLTFNLPFGLEAGKVGLTEPDSNVLGFFSDIITFTVVSGAVTQLAFASDETEGKLLFDNTISASNIIPETGTERDNGAFYAPQNNFIDPGSDATSIVADQLTFRYLFISDDSSVPEPGTLCSFAVGAAILGLFRRWRRQ